MDEESRRTGTRDGRRRDGGTIPFTIFDRGDRVDERYRIVRFIARGGAAEVYEAEDEELRHRVALKALVRDPSRSLLIERFKREINLARQVTHPNVCRIYEFGTHGRNVLFLTMELLGGETLLDRIQRQGRLRLEEVLPLARQMAAGLDAAHAAGVIHRDFKSGNVMIVPADDGGGTRAVITDFGLARAAAHDDPGPRVTAHDTLVGTPAYMAPEQVESGPLTPAADLYGFGVVIYEMVTGRYPFEGESSLATAILRLKEPPNPPSAHVPDLDPRWEAAILRCLELRPEKRFASAREVVDAIEHRSVAEVVTTAGPGGDETVAARAGSRRYAASAAIAAVLVLAAALVWWIRSGATLPAVTGKGTDESAMREPALLPPAPTAARRSLALLGFRNLSGDANSQWLASALTELLATEAAGGEHVRVIPGENVTRARIELGLGDVDDQLSASAVSRVGRLLGADLVVLGSYLAAGGELRIDLQVRETASGETAARISEQGSEDGVLDLIARSGASLREVLGIPELSAAEAETVRASQPAGTESARLYAQGLEQLRLENAREALRLLEAAARSNPDHPLIRSALSAAWDALGYVLKAREEGRRAVELAGGLSRRDQLWVEARYHDVAGDRDRAVANYALLWDHFPDNPEYGLRLARAQTSISRGEAALATVLRLRERSPAVGSDPRIDLAEADAARSLARYEMQQQRAAEAARKARELGATLLVARARELEANALRDLGKPEAAMAAYAEARKIYQDANHRGAVARLLIAQARIHRYQGRFEPARADVEEALEIARDIGYQETIRLALGSLALALRDLGRLSEALARHEMELETARELGEIRSIQIALTTSGVARREMGDLEGARASFEEALELSRQSGHRRSIATNLSLLGEVLLRQGRLEDARSHIEQALEINRGTGSRRGRAYYLANLAEVDRSSGRLAAARENHEEALALRQALGESTNVAFSRLALAELALDESRADDAVALALEAAEEFRIEKKSDAEGFARASLAYAKLRRGDTAGAEAEAEAASSLLEGSEYRGYRLVARIRASQIDAAAGRREAARRSLEDVVEQTAKLGFVDLGFEAALALGRLESEIDPAAARRRLESLASQAADRGFHRIAEQARRSLSPT